MKSLGKAIADAMPPKPDNPMPEPDQKRGPGRPRSNRIEFFDIDTFLRQNRKFRKFKRLLNLSEKDAWAIITSLFCYIAQSQALTPQIDDQNDLAEFCYFEGDPKSLIQALIDSDIISTNFHVKNWFQNQPFAQKKLYDSERYQKQKLEEYSTDFHVKTGEGSQQSSRRRVESSREESKKSKDRFSKDEKRPENVDNRPEPTENTDTTLINIVSTIGKLAEIYPTSKDFQQLHDLIHKLFREIDTNTANVVISKIKDQLTHGSVRNPIAYITGTINNELKQLS